MPERAIQILVGVAAVALLPAGIASCFFGYRIFKAVLGFAGFLAVGALAAWIAAEAGGTGRTIVIAAVVGGIVGAVLAVTIYRAGVFVFGAFAGASVAGLVCASSGIGAMTPLVQVAAGMVAGLLALVVQELVLVATTALAGALVLATAGLNLAGRLSGRVILDVATGRLSTPAAHPELQLVLGATVVVGLAGMVFQYRNAGDARERRAAANG